LIDVFLLLAILLLTAGVIALRRRVRALVPESPEALMGEETGSPSLLEPRR
jgi:cell division protein FtsL